MLMPIIVLMLKSEFTTDYLKVENPAAPDVSLKDVINENSLTILQNCKLESELKNAKLYENFQFMRKGYFCKDYDSTDENPVFNMTVALRSSWK